LFYSLTSNSAATQIPRKPYSSFFAQSWASWIGKGLNKLIGVTEPYFSSRKAPLSKSELSKKRQGKEKSSLIDLIKSNFNFDHKNLSIKKICPSSKNRFSELRLSSNHFIVKSQK